MEGNDEYEYRADVDSGRLPAWARKVADAQPELRLTGFSDPLG